MRFNLIVLLSIVLIACNKPKEDIAKKNIEEYLFKQMNDAKSYEFVSIDSLQFYSKFDSISNEIKLYELKNDADKTVLSSSEYLRESNDVEFTEYSAIEQLNEDIKRTRIEIVKNSLIIEKNPSKSN